MQQQFRKIIKQSGLASGGKLLLAVSGGVDSVVLLDLMAQCRDDFALQLQVLHLDHQLRPESSSDADFVRSLCARLKVRCSIVTVNVPELAKERRLSIETAGREARREALLSWAEEYESDRIVLGHHRDDQAETFLQRLLRGSGRSGLCGMSPLKGPWWRPLLVFSRQQILEYAAKRKLDWVEDASNTDTRYLRNRIRHGLLPELNRYNPQISTRLALLSQQFQLEEEFWQQRIAEVWPRLLLSDHDGLRLKRQLLMESHPALRLRLIRDALRLVRGDLRGIEAVHLDALLELSCGDRSQGELDLPGCWVARRYDQIWLRSNQPAAVEFDLSLKVGEPLLLPDGRTLLADFQKKTLPESIDLAIFDATVLQFPLQVRSLQPGDRFRPSGMKGHRKIKDFLIDLKVEKELRLSLPLLLNQGQILWLVGLRRSALFPVTSEVRKSLVVRLLEA